MGLANCSKQSKLRHERLVELYNYDPETGHFTSAVERKNCRKGRRVGAKHSEGYLVIQVDGARFFAHRLAWFYVHKEWPDTIDHANGSRSDNRLINLRNGTHAQNLVNKGSGSNKTGLRGVSKTPQNTFYAMISLNNKKHYLGCFATPEEAHQAYRDASLKIHGKFARFD